MKKQMINTCLKSLLGLLFVTGTAIADTEIPLINEQEQTEQEYSNKLEHVLVGDRVPETSDEQIEPAIQESLESPGFSKSMTSGPIAASTIYQVVGYNYFDDSISMQDGSIWTGPLGTSATVSMWSQLDTVLISINNAWFSDYKYVATNTRNGEKLKLNLFLGPLKNGLYTRTIISQDVYSGIIALNDGTYFKLSPYEASVARKWWINDCVIVGINTNSDAGFYPNILINVHTGQYVACYIIY